MNTVDHGNDAMAGYRPRRRPSLWSGQPSSPDHEPEPRHIGLLLRTVSNNTGQIAAAVTQYARELGARLSVEFTSHAEPGGPQARRLVASGVDTLVVAGGDGTVRRAAEAVVGTRVRLGIIPAGSGNVLAHALGLMRGSIADHARLAVTGAPRSCDLGMVSCRRSDGSTTPPAPFLCLAGMGLDAATVQATSHRLKDLMGPGAYAIAGSRTALARGTQMSWRVSDASGFDDSNGSENSAGSDDCGDDADGAANGAWADGTYWSVLAVNTPVVPGHIVIAPHARIDDARLDLMAVHPAWVGQWAGIAAKGIAGFDGDVPGLDYRSGQVIEAHSKDPLPVQADGDIVASDAVSMRAWIAGQVSIRLG